MSTSSTAHPTPFGALSLVDGLFRPNSITQKSLLAALDTTPRANFLPAQSAALGNADAPIQLGEGRGAFSALTLAHLIQALEIEPGDEVLILAGNLGYSAALCAHMGGHVTMVEDTAAFLAHAQKALSGLGGGIHAHFANANPATYTPAHPFAKVLLDATVSHLPAHAVNWLAEGGKLATVQVKPSTGMSEAVTYTRHKKALFAETLFDIKGQTPALADSRFLAPQTFEF